MKAGGAWWRDTIALLTPTPLRSHLMVSEITGKNPRINFRGFFIMPTHGKRRIPMDRTSKIIFALIAAGLWFNGAANLLRPAYAQQDALNDIKVSVRSIAQDLQFLVAGDVVACKNPRLCQ